MVSLIEPLRTSIRLAFRFLVRALSKRREYSGVAIYDFLGTGSEDPSFMAKLEEALELIARYDQRTLHRVGELTIGLVLFDHPRAHGSWHRDSREIRLSPMTFRDSSATDLASTIVHEAAHAWLTALGFESRPDRRHRIEAVCYRAQAAFARRVPDERELAELYEGCALVALADGPQAFSDQARRELDLSALADLGAPKWIVRLLQPRDRRGSA